MTHRTALEAAERALELVRSIIVDGAETGFNYKNGDWAERLFTSQGQSHDALALVKAALAEDKPTFGPQSSEHGWVSEPTDGFHWRDGWRFKRLEHGSVRISHRGFVAEIDERSWASIVASVSAVGETKETWDAARDFHNRSVPIPTLAEKDEVERLREENARLKRTLEWIGERASSGGRRLETAAGACDEIESASREALNGEKAEAQLALPVAGEVEEVAARLDEYAIGVSQSYSRGLCEAAALLRRFGRVPKLETTGYELERLLKRAEERILIGGDMIKLNAGTLLRFLRDYGTLLSHISTDGATEVGNG